MQGVVQNGVGGNPTDVRADYSPELAVAGNADALIDRVNRCLMYGTMSTEMRNDVRTAINSIAMTGNGSTNRVRTAVLLTLASPEYLAQK